MKNQIPSKHSNRNKKNFGIILFGITILLFVIIAFRLINIMVIGKVNGQDLAEHISQLYASHDEVQAKRGTIYDKNNNPIAVDAKSYKMLAILTDEWSNEERPIHVQQPDAIATILSNHLPISYEEAYKKLTSSSSQVEFGSAGNNLSYDTVSAIQEELKAQELTGLTFEESQTRLYPNGVFASHIVGLAQGDNGEEETEEDEQITGVMGLEAEFNEQLTGENGKVAYQKDRYGYALPDEQVNAIESVDGLNVHMTLDRRLQTYLENIMTAVEEENSPKAMTATVMDAQTGEIIAASQRPTFNAMTKEGIDQSWQNLLVDYEFEPGSTLKIITLAAAIEEGVFNPNETYQSGTYYMENGGRVRDIRPEGWGTITYLEGLFRSSNVSFVKLVEKMGFDTWKSYLDAFGFGTETGIELPNERSGQNPYEWDLQKANTAFGQGITITPIQMLQALTAITNGGEMVQPSIVSSITDSEQTEQETLETEVVGNPISKETAEKTLEYLQMGVESEVGTTRGYRTEGVSIAAKTGTAQIVNPETGQYYSSSTDFVFSVVTMFPADNPKYVIYITVQQPEVSANAPHGSLVVQNIFKPLSQRLLIQEGASIEETYENIDEPINTSMPRLTEQQTSEVTANLDTLDVNYSVIGTGDIVVSQYPFSGSQIYSGERVILLTNGAMSMPDITNWSRTDVLKLSEMTGLDIEFEGEGYVLSQSIAPGTFIETEDTLHVTLHNPNNESFESESTEEIVEHPDQIWEESTFEE